jgi:hypothetical protein
MTKDAEERFQLLDECLGPRDIALDHVRQSAGDVVVLVRDQASARFFELRFEAPLVLRTSLESFRLRALEAAVPARKGISRVHGSELMRWAREEACGVLDDADLRHFLICTDDDFVEVLTRFEPTTRWLEPAEEPSWPAWGA